MRTLFVAVGIGTITLVWGWLGGFQNAQEPRSVIDFEGLGHGWFVFPGFDGKVELTQNERDVKSGKQALQYTYVSAQGKLNGIIRLEPEPWAQAFRFWVKTDRPALLAMLIQEEDGERWQAPFWVNGNTWQQVTLALPDFTLAEDVKPVNNKLEMDKAEGIGILDVSALLFTAPEVALLFGPQTGTRVLWLDDFEFRSQAPARTRNPRVLDDFQRDYLTWIATYGVSIQPEANGMRVSYEQPFPSILGVLRPLEKEALANTKGLEIVIQVKTLTTLAVFVEEADGERWSATQAVGGESKPEAKTFLWNQFTITDDTKGKGDGKLNPGTIRLLSFVDWGALFEERPTTNTWWVRAVRKVPNP